MRILFALAIFASLQFATLQAKAEIVAIPAPPSIAAKAWLMMDMNTGKVLAQSSQDKQLEPASLTKVMTAYVVLNQLRKGAVSIDDEVLVSKKAWKMGGSRMFIEQGKRVKLEDLLRGLIVQSGNDAAVALAEFISGSEEKFVALMNAEAQRLGMTKTYFKNPTGWPDPEHLTTASDLMILAKALISDLPEYYGYYSEKSFTYNKISQRNRNRLLWRDESVDGIKTGHTDVSGYSLMASAKRGDMRLITVLLGANNEQARSKYTQNLFNYAYHYYQTKKLFSQGQTLRTARVWKGEQSNVDLVAAEDVYVTIPRGHYSSLKATMHVELSLTAPVKQGVRYGQGDIKIQGTDLKKFPITAKTAVARGNLWQVMRDSVLSIFN